MINTALSIVSVWTANNALNISIFLVLVPFPTIINVLYFAIVKFKFLYIPFKHLIAF